MISGYVRQGRQLLQRWAADPRVDDGVKYAACGLAGFCLSAASLEQGALPLAMGLVWATSGWAAVLAAGAGAVGYGIFWGMAGVQGCLWVAFALLGTLLLTDRKSNREVPLLIPALGMLTVTATGLGFQLLAEDTTPVLLYLLRAALGGLSPWIFSQAQEGRRMFAQWGGWALLTMGLTQLAPLPWLGLGFVAAGAASVKAPLPCAAMVGLAVDLAGITPVSVTGVVTAVCLCRLLLQNYRRLCCLLPGMMGLAVMRLCGHWDPVILPGLLVGGAAGVLLPWSGGQSYRKGETGAAQVRLEMAAGILTQTRQLLTEVPETGVDEAALVARAAERACAGCSARKNCRDSKRLILLPGALLRKPLLTAEELPIPCRKGNRFLAELRRSQEQLRAIQADRERQREYRAAVIQQYYFLSHFLQDLSDQLSRRGHCWAAVYEPKVMVYGNRTKEANADRCLQFPGVENLYYIIMCDGMGTGAGAVQEGKTAGGLLFRMLSVGFPAAFALRSLNSLCALRDRAGAVTVDLVQLELDSGKATLHKWGAAPSYVLSGDGVEKLGTPSVPPGLSVEEDSQEICRTALRREQLLVLTSDGMAEERVLQVCREKTGADPEVLAQTLLEQAQVGEEDDATVVTVQLMRIKT